MCAYSPQGLMRSSSTNVPLLHDLLRGVGAEIESACYRWLDGQVWGSWSPMGRINGEQFEGFVNNVFCLFEIQCYLPLSANLTTGGAL